MTHQLNEDQLRDLLIPRLDVIEPELQFLDKEKFVPNELGTRGFIDILAKDAQNHFVLIELKRSDTASREAIHEVLKYVENVKKHLSVRDDEIRVIIASTDWKELHVPFSRFCSDTNLEIKGVKIVLSDNAEAVEAHQVKPLVITQGRFISPWHELNFYIDEESMKRGITEYEDSCGKKGVEDYILLVLLAPTGFHTSTLEQTRAAIIGSISRMGGEPDEAQISASVSN